jgi:hypothetical protein
MKKLILFLSCATLVFATTIKVWYRGTTSMTVTHLQSLANSSSTSTGNWASAAVDNTTNMDVDEQVYVQVTTGSSGVSSTGTVIVYAYGCLGETSICSDGLSGGEGTVVYSSTSPNLMKLGSCNVTANSTMYVCGPYSIANAFGGAVPARWGISLENLTGTALGPNGNNVWYDSLQMTNQ